jgi:hypothetical protein
MNSTVIDYETRCRANAKRPDPPFDDWKIVWGCIHEFAGVEGVKRVDNTFNCSIKSTGDHFTIPDSSGKGLYTFSVFDLTKETGEVVQAANCEVSNGVWASGVRDKA